MHRLIEKMPDNNTAIKAVIAGLTCNPLQNDTVISSKVRIPLQTRRGLPLANLSLQDCGCLLPQEWRIVFLEISFNKSFNNFVSSAVDKFLIVGTWLIMSLHVFCNINKRLLMLFEAGTMICFILYFLPLITLIFTIFLPQGSQRLRKVRKKTNH